jgi:hypothetical protein
MSRYSVKRADSTKKTQQTHVVWRGIGCLLILIVPLMAWVLADFTLEAGLRAGWPLPYQLLGYPVLPAALWNVRALWPVLGFIVQQQHLYMVLVFALLYILAISGVLSFGYAFVYRYVGPPRYGPLDLPQPQIKIGRYKR